MPLDTTQRIVTLGEIITIVQTDQSLGPTQKRDWCSSIRSFVKCVDRDLTVEANPGQLRAALKNGPPPGTNRKTWANIRSNVGAAMRHCGCIANNKVCGVTKADWNEIRRFLPSVRLQRGLSRFCNWCARQGLYPSDVNQGSFDRFYDYLTHQTLLSTPDAALISTIGLWNQAAQSVREWPKTKFIAPTRREVITLGESTFPLTFREDLDTWERQVSGKDRLNSSRRIKVLRPATIQSNRKTFVRCASILVRRGQKADSITSLRSLVDPSNTLVILEDYLERHNNELTRGTENVANLLAGLGRNWVNVSEEDQAQLDDLAARLDTNSRGMSDKSKSRLRQFEDPELMARFIDLPWTFKERARKTANPIKAARNMRLAVLVGLALCAPVRRRNLVELHLDHHFSLRRHGRNRVCHLHYSAQEVKNKVDVDFMINSDVTNLFIEYRDQYRPALLKNDGDRWLFPGDVAGRHLTPEQLSSHLCEAIARELNVKFNLQLFRHLAAKIYLERHPDDFVTVQQLLGHKQIQTTIDFYCDFDRVKALARYDNALFGDRG